MPNKNEPRRFGIPLFQGILPISRSQLPGEVLAGLTLAALAIPEVMGYTRIAGTPVITGLYTILFPMALFAVFGSSRHLVVGADSATAAMIAAGLAGLAMPGSSEYTALAGVLALMAAGFLFAARVVRLSFLADFLSRTVLVGFLTGVGIQVALGQLGGMLGIAGGRDDPWGQVTGLWKGLGQADPRVVGLSAAVVVVTVGLRRVSRRLPGALVAVVAAIVASWALDLESHGMAVLGTVPGGLPTLGLPQVSWSWPLLRELLPTAGAIFVVILAQSAATSRAYAVRHNEGFSEAVDLVGLGMANLGAGLGGTFVVNGSPTKTQMVESAGGSSQLSQLVTTCVVLTVLLFLTGPLAYLPEAVLSAVVFLIGVELMDVRELRRILRERPWEFWVAFITLIVVVFWGVEQGIILAVFLSLLAHTRHGYRPKNAVLVTNEEGQWSPRPVSSSAQILPGLLIYRFTHSMYYANADLLSRQILELAEESRPPLSWLCVECTAVDDVDFTAAEVLLSLARILEGRGTRLVLTGMSADVKAELDRSGVTGGSGPASSYPSLKDVVSAYSREREEAGNGRPSSSSPGDGRPSGKPG